MHMLGTFHPTPPPLLRLLLLLRGERLAPLGITLVPRCPLGSLQETHAAALLASNAQRAEDQLGCARRACVRRDSISHQARVRVAVNRTKSRHVAEVALADSRNLAHGVGEDDQVGEVRPVHNRTDTEAAIRKGKKSNLQRLCVGKHTRQPFPNNECVVPESFLDLVQGFAVLGNKQHLAVRLDDITHKRSRSAKHRQCLFQVDDAQS